MLYDLLVVFLMFLMVLNSIAWLGVGVLLFWVLLDYIKHQQTMKQYLDSFRKFFHWS